MSKTFKSVALLFAFVLFCITDAFALDDDYLYYGWSMRQQAIWDQMRTANPPHPVWVDFKTQVDDSRNDDYFMQALMYRITGETAYANKAIEFIQADFGDLTARGNNLREHFPIISFIYPWLLEVANSSQRTILQTILNDMVARTTTSPNNHDVTVRLLDSDQATAQYLGVVQYALTGPSQASSYLNYSPPSPGALRPAVGGLNATASELKDNLRNSMAYYAAQSSGGEYIESSRYNQHAIVAFMSPILAINALQESNHFPEYTALLEDFGKVVKAQLTPDLNDGYTWGDVSGLDLWLYHRLATLAFLAYELADINPVLASELWYLCDYYLEGYSSSSGRNAHFWQYYDPYAPRRAPINRVETYNAKGQGIAYHQEGRRFQDSGFFSHMFPINRGNQLTSNTNTVDHYIRSPSNFRLYRDGEWVLDSIDGDVSASAFTYNSMAVRGFDSVNEARGQAAYYADNKVTYHVGTNGGYTEINSFEPPPEYLHEWTRSQFYRLNGNGSETIVTFDRVDSEDPKALPKYDKHRSSTRFFFDYFDSKNIWTMNLPNTTTSASGNRLSWSSEGGQPLSLTTHLPSQYSRSVHNASSFRSAGVITGTIDEQELNKKQLHITSILSRPFETFLNMIQVGTGSNSSLIESFAGEKAQGVRYVTGSETVVVMFNGEQGDMTPSTAIVNEKSALDPQKLANLSTQHLFDAGFKMTLPSAGNIDVYLGGLNPASTWRMDVNGVVRLLAVDSSGFAKTVLPATGVKNIEVYANGVRVNGEFDPPSPDPVGDDDMCLPIKGKNGAIAVICL